MGVIGIKVNDESLDLNRVHAFEYDTNNPSSSHVTYDCGYEGLRRLTGRIEIITGVTHD